MFGTEAGGIYHAAFVVEEGRIEVLEKFECVVELPEARAILDIKVAQLSDSSLILAVTDSCLYQFAGAEQTRTVLQTAGKDPTSITKHMLMIEASVQGLDNARSVSEQQDEASHVSLQVFYDHRAPKLEPRPLGFGWQHELKFCFAEFNVNHSSLGDELRPLA